MATRDVPLLMVVEDDPNDADLFDLAVQRSGHSVGVIRAADGEQALEHLHHLEQSARDVLVVVFSDITMPRMTGIEFIRTLRGDPDLHTVPVVVFTNSSADSDVVASYESGCNAYLVKPDTFPELISSVAHALDFWLDPYLRVLT